MKSLIYSRTGLLAILLLGVMAIFVLRLFQLQILEHGKYVELARMSQQRQFVVPAERGKIYMMDGKTVVPVVLNQTIYTVIADPQVIEESEKNNIVTSMREIAGGEVVDNIEAKLANKKSRYEVLARNISKAQAEKLKAKKYAGILYQQGSIRNYPEGKLGAQVLGFVNAEGKGQYGVEGELNDRLKGRDGLLQAVTDVRNVPLTIGRDNVRVEAKAGENVVLTVDRNIQSYVEDALAKGATLTRATQGSVVVMNPNNGQVLAMANYPTYNPAEYSKQTDANVFVNGATMIPFEPASVVKTFSMSTGIDKGVITPQTTYQNVDCTTVSDRRICNATRGLGGTRSMQFAFNNSLNVGTIEVARRLGSSSNITYSARQTLYEYYHDRFGFGQATGIELAEVAGLINKPNVSGAEVNYANMTFGQGLNVTMIQTAAAFSSVVNGGNYYRPTITNGKITPNGSVKVVQPKALRQTVSAQTSAAMRGMLSTSRSLSAMHRNDPIGYEIGGKTGTAETLVNGSYTQNETAATYVGYGGKDRPEYVIMVRVSAPGKGLSLEGGRHAGPIFTDISNWMIDYMKIAPKG